MEASLHRALKKSMFLCYPMDLRFFQKWKEEENGRPGNKVFPREKHFGVSRDEVAVRPRK